MICRTCLRQAARLTTRQTPSALPLPRTTTTTLRPFSTTLPTRNAAPSPASAAPAAAEGAPDLTPLTPAQPDGKAPAAPLSSCAPGTPLNGLNYFKGKTDPVALADDAYPAWLWNCLEVQKKAASTADADAGDEFCSSPHLHQFSQQCH